MAHSTTGTDKKGLKARERAIQALELRKAGADYRQIGVALECSPQRAHQIVSAYLNKLNKQLAEGVEDVTAMEEQRLDALFMAAWPAAKAGDAQSIAVALRVMERRARMLGLDAPTKNEHTGEGGRAIAMELMTERHYDRLTPEELTEYYRLTKKLEAPEGDVIEIEANEPEENEA